MLECNIKHSGIVLVENVYFCSHVIQVVFNLVLLYGYICFKLNAVPFKQLNNGRVL